MNKIIILSYLFGFSELILMFVKRSRAGRTRTRQDKGSLILLWVCIVLGFTGGFFLSGPVNQFWAGFGATLLIGGLIIRWISILTLGKSFTVDVAITKDASLKTDGIYEFVRHPSYTGIILIVTGFSALMNSFWSFIVLVIPVFLAVVYRISVEEELLLSEFGASYENYMATTRKLIPLIF
jgi:protein-S-isoprenylcysteine O-methyltransferase Ste14